MTRSGSLVAPRTRSVTLPSASRCKPPRPWVAIAIRSQLPNIAVPSASLPVSATLRRALVTSFPAATEQMIVSLRSAETEPNRKATLTREWRGIRPEVTLTISFPKEGKR